MAIANSKNRRRNQLEYPLPAGVGIWFVFVLLTSVGYCRTWIGWPVIILNLVELYWVCYKYSLGKKIVVMGSYILSGICVVSGIHTLIVAAKTNDIGYLYASLASMFLAGCYCLAAAYFQFSSYVAKALYK